MINIYNIYKPAYSYLFPSQIVEIQRAKHDLVKGELRLSLYVNLDLPKVNHLTSHLR